MWISDVLLVGGGNLRVVVHLWNANINESVVGDVMGRKCLVYSDL